MTKLVGVISFISAIFAQNLKVSVKHNEWSKACFDSAMAREDRIGSNEID